MTRFRFHPIANGLHTDHPIPDLPFVNDSHLPLDDPKGIEALGRRRGTGTWGREDVCRGGAGWVAFTTDPLRHDLAWVVRRHPDRGRTVALFRNADAVRQHGAWCGPALLFRAGGYWWDGHMWFRPLQVWDPTREHYLQRPVPAATTVTAGDLLTINAAAARAHVLEVIDVDADTPPIDRWADHLALWALHRSDARSLDTCVVTIAAPELAADQLVDLDGLAEAAGLAPSTLRDFISHGDADLPLPQVALNGRNMWARPVVQEWAESRHRSRDSVVAAVSGERCGVQMSVGAIEVWNRLSLSFFDRMWTDPDQRRRFALRTRNAVGIRDLAETLSRDVATSIDTLVPIDALAATITHAVLDELATGRHLHRGTTARGARLLSVHAVDVTGDDTAGDDAPYYGIRQPVVQSLDWLIRHKPAAAGHAIAEIIGEGEARLGIPRNVSERSIATALALDSKLEPEVIEKFLACVLAPGHDGD